MRTVVPQKEAKLKLNDLAFFLSLVCASHQFPDILKGELSAMFDNVSRKLAEKMGRGVKEAAEPIKAEVKKVASNKVDLYSRVLRLGILILLFVDGTRRVSNLADPTKDSPNQIVINNYIDTTRLKPPYGNGRGQNRGKGR